MKKKGNQTNNILPNSNTNHPSQLSSFPIWEKVYLDMKDFKDQDAFFDNSMLVQNGRNIYIFPKNKQSNGKKSNHYAILDLDSESLFLNEMDIDCFCPVYEQGTNIIYLFSYDDSYLSDGRYMLIEYNIENKSFSYTQHKGVAPKARSESFTAFIMNGKIFFFGGLQMFPGDNSGTFLFSFNIKEYEWNIETYTGIFHNDNPNLPYISNTFNVASIQISKDKMLLIGGNYFDELFYSDIISYKLQNAKESNEIVEFNFTTMSFSKKTVSNYFISDIRFNHHSVSPSMIKETIIIHNKGQLYSYDIELNEIAMYKPILFNAEEQSSSSLILHSSYLYVIGHFKCYEDCYIFKTSFDNLIPKWNSEKLISYEQLLNVKDCSDMICSFNNGDKTKEVFLNKKIMFNFSLALKNLIVNRFQNSNVYIFNDINYISMYNTLKFIYSNFNDSLSSIDYEIMNEIFYIILRYRAKSLLNIIINHIQLTNENAIAYYQIAVKHNQINFIKNCSRYISENLQSGLIMNEGIDMKKALYENFFCSHKIYVQANVIGIDIKNASQVTLTTERVNEIKELSKEGKMLYCLICKKVFKENE